MAQRKKDTKMSIFKSKTNLIERTHLLRNSEIPTVKLFYMHEKFNQIITFNYICLQQCFSMFQHFRHYSSGFRRIKIVHCSISSLK